MLETIIALLLAGSIALSQFVPSSETLRLAFEHGQKLFAIEDYEQAAEKYMKVRQTESRLLNAEQVLVHIETFKLPIKIAATYQLGNCYHQMALNKYKLATSGDVTPARTEELKKESVADFKKAADYYKEVVEKTTSEKLKALARYQLIKTRFQAREYQKAAEEAKTFLENYPTSEYVEAALYELGWSYYYLKRYPEAIATFKDLVERFPEGYRADRAQFQIGESYLKMGQTAKAREAFTTLIEKHRVDKLTEKEKIWMETQKLIGVVHETVVELTAKAHILIGDSYLTEGKEQEAVEAYETMVREYPKQFKLVESAYVKMADIYFKRNDLRAGFRRYLEAIRRIPDRIFRAKMQARIAMKYYDLGQYERAIEEFRVYIKGYPVEAREAGFRLAQAQLQIAQCYYQMGEASTAAGEPQKAKEQYQKAKTEYQKVIDTYPTSKLVPAALLGMGLSEHRIGLPESLERAVDYFKQVVTQYPGSKYASRALLQTARVYRDRNQLKKAIATYNEFLNKYPESQNRDVGYLELGLSYRDTGETERTLDILYRVSKMSDLFSKARLLISEIEIGRKNYEQAESALTEVLLSTKDKKVADDIHYGLARVFMAKKDYPRAVEEFTIVINDSLKETQVKNALFGRGFSYYKMEKYQQAKADLDRLMAIGVPPTLRDQTHRLLGRINVSLGRKQEAIKSYLALIQTSKDPKQKAEYLLLLAELYHGIGDFPNAIKWAQAGIDLQFEDFTGDRGYFIKERCYFLLGDSFTKMGKFEQAIVYFKTGLEKFPKAAHSPEFLFGIAIVDFSLEDYPKAITMFNRFLKLYPTNPNRENAFYYLGYSYLKESRFEEAVGAFSSLVKAFPGSPLVPEATFQIGENYFNLREYEKALKAYKKVWKQYSQSPFADVALYNVGWCYVELNRMDEGVAAFRELLDQYPNSAYAASAQFTLGDYYFNMKEYEKAAAEYEKVITNYPDSPLAAKAQGLLKELEDIRAYLKYVEGMKYFDQQDYEAAIKVFQEVVDRFPGADSKAGALVNMGVAYEFLHQWKKAVEIYKRVLKEYADDISHRDAFVFAKEHHDWVVANRL